MVNMRLGWVIIVLLVCFIQTPVFSGEFWIEPAFYLGDNNNFATPLNYYAHLVIGQAGGELNLPFFQFALLGELGGGLGLPFLFEYTLSGTGEIYFTSDDGDPYDRKNRFHWGLGGS